MALAYKKSGPAFLPARDPMAFHTGQWGYSYLSFMTLKAGYTH